jgi:hypothetical protein
MRLLVGSPSLAQEPTYRNLSASRAPDDKRHSHSAARGSSSDASGRCAQASASRAATRSLSSWSNSRSSRIFVALAHLRCAEPCCPLALDVGDRLARGRVDLAAARGCAHELGAAICGVGDAFDVAVLLQVCDQFRHRLLGDLRASRELADLRSAVVQECEDVAVRRADRLMSALGDAPVQFLVRDSIRLAQKQSEIDGGSFPARA